ncbi:DUF6153 family protein [Streptomyces sp. NPDC006283]|uniref:DUF6153 family protein n=1 Tax=Streptomyces sp. NPDC006283 TaxID=3156741 RepID=UPI0033B57C3F
MTFATPPTNRRPAGRGFVLLVLAVLAGVLGMHALGPGPAPAMQAGADHAMAVAHAQGVSVAMGDCSHSAGGADHLDHADGTCAATGVGSPYTPPAPSPAFADAPAAVELVGGAQESAGRTRAPPALSELQLLRI